MTATWEPLEAYVADGTGPVRFSNKPAPIPKVPQPRLQGFVSKMPVLGSTHPSRGQVGMAYLLATCLAGYAVMKGRKQDRKRNTMMLVGALSLGVLSVGLTEAS
jgi:hypothetical protein